MNVRCGKIMKISPNIIPTLKIILLGWFNKNNFFPFCLQNLNLFLLQLWLELRSSFCVDYFKLVNKISFKLFYFPFSRKFIENSFSEAFAEINFGKAGRASKEKLFIQTIFFRFSFATRLTILLWSSLLDLCSQQENFPWFISCCESWNSHKIIWKSLISCQATCCCSTMELTTGNTKNKFPGVPQRKKKNRDHENRRSSASEDFKLSERERKNLSKKFLCNFVNFLSKFIFIAEKAFGIGSWINKT